MEKVIIKVENGDREPLELTAHDGGFIMTSQEGKHLDVQVVTITEVGARSLGEALNTTLQAENTRLREQNEELSKKLHDLSLHVQKLPFPYCLDYIVMG